MKPSRVFLYLLMSLGGMFVVLGVFIVAVSFLKGVADWFDNQITYWQQEGKWWVMLFPSYIISFLLYIWWDIKHRNQ